MTQEITTKTCSKCKVEKTVGEFFKNKSMELEKIKMGAIIIAKNTELAQRVIDMIKTCYDPEIPVDIWELGLIYEINLDDENNLKVVMTLTSPSCPVAETLPPEVEQNLKRIEGVKSAKIDLTFEPSWEKSMMSEVAQVELGFM